MVTWSEDIFSPNIHQSCINGYEWSINDVSQGIVTEPSITLDCSLTNRDTCNDTTLSIHPRVIFESTVIPLVILNGTTCNRGELHIPTGIIWEAYELIHSAL